MMKAVKRTLTTWKTPQVIGIVDWKLGALFWTLRIGVAAYVIYRIWFDVGGMKSTETPIGYPTFWFESGGLRGAQNFTTAPSYCDNADYDYHYVAGGSEMYWNDMDIGCTNVNYGDIVQKTMSSAFAISYIKSLHTHTFPCSASNAGSPCSMVSIAGNRTAEDSWIYDTLGGGATCTCSKQHDKFVVGLEEMELVVLHDFEAAEIGGKSILTSSSEDMKSIKTCLKNQAEKDATECNNPDFGVDEEHTGKCCWKVFQPGEDMALSVREWLQAAGISLDDLNTGVEPDERFVQGEDVTEYPTRRVTGTTLRLKMKYYGDHSWDKPFRCSIDVEHEDSWTSLGSKVIRVSYAGMGDSEYYDMWRRGLAFTFEPTGVITKFDWIALVNTIVSGLVFLALVDNIVGVFAFFIVPHADINTKACVEELHYSHALARFGINVALACQAFKTWNKGDGGTEAAISKDELADVYKDCFDTETANNLSEVVIEQAVGDQKATELKFSHLVKLMSTGLVSIDRIKKFAEIHADDPEEHPEKPNSNQVAPA
jgi:hypothetical protein